MKYNPILKVPADKDGTFSKQKILDFIEGLGYQLLPVKGAVNKYWITGKIEDGELLDFVSGAKYYKLIINDKDFGIASAGDYNAWQFAMDIRTVIKTKGAKAWVK